MGQTYWVDGKNTYLHEFTVHLSGQTFATGDIRVFLRVVAGEERREKREERREKREDTESHKKDKVFFDRHVS